ncbi:hypothetical protein GC096_13235 [Paenibacillus sp. LMG 31461]|uniref:DUF7689 domain-containing protein n=1 Tax=Paenibacillus plantarum TaxID=2654975 RepID=A0ABX1X9C0_9BACL|nr:hypothetical protein [Paenibacillus plantarum]NOU64994.1 hypothetical protein [Paenibacillus plantarum]
MTRLLIGKKKLVTAAIAVGAIASGATTALAGITTSTYTLDSMVSTAGNYAWLGDATGTYNCLAYALGNYSSWDWPWGVSNPDTWKADTYLKSKGFGTSKDISSTDVAAYEIISYGNIYSITHFSRIAASNYTNAKWGNYELLQSYGWQPYSASNYGPGVKKYAH